MSSSSFIPLIYHAWLGNWSQGISFCIYFGRGVRTLLFYEDRPPPPILPTLPPFSNFVQPLLPCCHQPQPSLLFLLPCFFDQMDDCTTIDVLFCLMILWIHICQTLVPQYQRGLDVYFMQQGVKFTEVWHMWFFGGTLIWYHIHTNT